jgi:hypothetical protein
VQTVQVDDYAILFVCTANQDPTSPTPYYACGTPGSAQHYTMTSIGAIGTGTAGGAGAVKLLVYYKQITTGLTDMLGFYVGDSGSYQAAAGVVLRGVNTTTPISGTATRLDASATTTITMPITQAPSSTQILVHAVGLDRDTSSNPYTAVAGGPGGTGSFRNFVSGTQYDTALGAVTNAGAGGGLFVQGFTSAVNWSYADYSWADSTTHAYVSFYVNEPVNATFSTTTAASATASGKIGLLREGPIVVRSWTASGMHDVPGASGYVTMTTIKGTDYPQVGDTVVVVYGFDALSATTPDWITGDPQINSGTGSVGSWTKYDLDGTTATDWAKGAIAWATVTGAFAADTRLRAGVNQITDKKAAVAFAVSGGTVSLPYSLAEASGLFYANTSGYTSKDLAFLLTTSECQPTNTDTIATAGIDLVRDGTANGTGLNDITTVAAYSRGTDVNFATSVIGEGTFWRLKIQAVTTFSTTTGNANAAGNAGASSGEATFSTATGNAPASGNIGMLRWGVVYVPLSSFANGTNTPTSTATANISSTYVQPGDLVLVTITVAGVGVGLTTPDGWTLVKNQTGDGNLYMSVYSRVRQAGDGNFSASITGVTSAYGFSTIAFRGQAETNYIGTPVGLTDSTSNTTLDIPGITTTGYESARVALNGLLAADVQANNAPSGLTRINQSTPGHSTFAGWGPNASPATIGSTTWSIISSTTGVSVQVEVYSPSVSPDATFSATTTGNATAAGNSGALKGDATFAATTVGDSTAAGGSGALLGGAALTTSVGNVAAAGNSGSLTGSATFAATTVGDAAASGNAGALRASITLTTTVGNASASGGDGALTGGATLTTTVGDASAAGNEGSLIGTADAILTTTVGNSNAAGNEGSMTGTVSATFTTVSAGATASGGSGSFTGTADATLTTAVGDSSASGNAGALTGGATLTTQAGDISASGGTGSMYEASANATLTTTVGDATATGLEGALTGGATLTTQVGDVAASGNEGALRVPQTLTTEAGNATADGQVGALRSSGTLTTQTGDTAASGGSTVFGVALTTAVGDAAAAGGEGSMSGTEVATLTTTVGDASASGGDTTYTGTALFSTAVGDANALGNEGSMAATENATLTTATGDATAEGLAEAWTGDANLLSTVAGGATASGGQGVFTGTASAIFTTQAAVTTAEGGTGPFYSDVSVPTDTGTVTAAGGDGSYTGTANLITVVGDSTASGNEGSLRTSGTLTTEAGNASADGGAGSLIGEVVFSTTAGNASASGGDTTYTGDGLLSTSQASTATAAGGSGSMTGTGLEGTFTTATGNANAGGYMGAMSGTTQQTSDVSSTGTSASGTNWVNPTNATGSPNDNYATWTNNQRSTTATLTVGGFGTWASIPAGSTINSVTITVQHHESHVATPVASITGQAFLGATGQGSPTTFTRSLTDRDDTITPTLTLAELQGNTLDVQIVATRANSTTQSIFYVDAVSVLVNYTYATQTKNVVFNIDPGLVTAAGGTGDMHPSFDITMTTTVGNATAAGSNTNLLGGATLTTSTGDVAASGGAGSFTGNGLLVTTSGDASASGGQNAFLAESILHTTVGDAAASGGQGYLIGSAGGTFSTTPGSAQAAGGTGSLIGSTAATLTTTTGNADATGNSGNMFGSASFGTITAESVAAGLNVTFTGEAKMTFVAGEATSSGGVAALLGGATFLSTVGTVTGAGGETNTSGTALLQTVGANATARGGIGHLKGKRVYRGWGIPI